MRVRHSSWFAVALLSVAACSGSESEPVTVRSDGVEMAASVSPANLRVGKNVLNLRVRDEDGRPVEGAEVGVKVHMHAMGAMPAMGGPATVTEVGDGRYQAEFELEMGSTWNVEIEARTEGGPTARAEGSLTVGTPGLRLQGIGRAGSDSAANAPEPAMADGRHPAEFQIEPERLQRVGVKTARVESKPIQTTIRALGRVVAEETTLVDVSPKVRGWVGQVHVDAVGDPVERGETLFTLYSPELYAAQEEYLQALRSQARAQTTSAPDRADYLVRAARNRLRLWDIAERDLDRLARGGAPIEHLPIRAPVGGYVVEKNLVGGSAFQPGARLYRIAPLSEVWIEANVYEYELPLVHEGQRASVTLPYLRDRTIDATVAYVYPVLDASTRTARLRLEIPNPDLALRPDMYANVRIEAERGEGLVVPLSAVLHAGERSFVFRALGGGRFRPQPVETGLRMGEQIEIRAGLAAGDAIVSSGTFLIASESRLRSALEQW